MVESVVDLTIAFREGGITSFSSSHVGNPVCYGDRSSEHNIDRVVGWQVAYEAFCVVLLIVNYKHGLKTFRCAFISMRNVVILAAIGISRKLTGNFSFT